MTAGPESSGGQAAVLTEAEKRKQEAEADLAEFTRDKARDELVEWNRRASERDREARAKLDELRLKNEDLERSAIKAMIPDLSGVERGTTAVPDSTLFDALLGGRALQDAARNLVEAVRGLQPKGQEHGQQKKVRFIVTTDLELAARDARYVSVVEQLKRLNAKVEEVLRARHRDGVRSFGPTGLAVGLAQLLPGLLSLISANRTLTTSTSQPDADVTMMAVAGALASSGFATVVVEKTRLLTGAGAVEGSWAVLEEGIRKLDEEITAEEKKVKAAVKDADMGPSEEWLGTAKSFLSSCKAAATALTTVPEGGQLSMLGQATLQEALHDPELGGVLVVKAGAASATQLVDDKPLHFDDPVSVISTATIAYLLLDPKESHVVLGGLAHGVSQFAGKVGSWLELPPEPGSVPSEQGVDSSRGWVP